MSARCVTETVAEQTLFPLRAPLRNIVSEDQFAESLHSGIKTAAQAVVKASSSSVPLPGKAALGVKTASGSVVSPTDGKLSANNASVQMGGKDMPQPPLERQPDPGQSQNVAFSLGAATHVGSSPAAEKIGDMQSGMHVDASPAGGAGTHESATAHSIKFDASKPSPEAATPAKKLKWDKGSSGNAILAPHASPIPQVPENGVVSNKVVPYPALGTESPGQLLPRQPGAQAGDSAAIQATNSALPSPAGGQPILSGKFRMVDLKDLEPSVSGVAQQVDAGKSQLGNDGEALSSKPYIAHSGDSGELAGSTLVKIDANGPVAPPVNASGVISHLDILNNAADKNQLSAASPMHASVLPPGQEESRNYSNDSGLIRGAPRVLLANQTTLEVGVQSGTHGWLKVRAELTDGGGVQASLEVSSSTAEVDLRHEVPGLSAYLQEEKVSFSSIVVHPAAPFSTESQASAFGTNERDGGRAQQEANQRQPREHLEQSLRPQMPARASIDRSWNGDGQATAIATERLRRGSSWLSVLA